MPAFRPALAQSDSRPLSAPVVRELCAFVTRPANFFVDQPGRLVWDHSPDEGVFWELFHGRALDGTQTRERRRFEAWNVYALGADNERSSEPLLSVKYDEPAGHVHITRAIQCYAHEPYDAGGNIIETREVVRWQRELVGTIVLSELSDAGALLDELACRLYQAVVGTSRLPLTSVEAPQPAFTFGRLGYFYQVRDFELSGSEPNDLYDLILTMRTSGTGYEERVKAWELMLRGGDLDYSEDADLFDSYLDAQSKPRRTVHAFFRDLFNGVSLSPYTPFVGRALELLKYWSRLEGKETQRRLARVEILAGLVRLVARHLAAYDLVTFHHRGANYPDALLLDEVLAELWPLIQEEPELFQASLLLRQAIRLGLILVAEYRGHPVPDVPTSPGENRRVMPGKDSRVPDEQIDSPITRQRRLFTETTLPVNDVVRDCFRDLDDPYELRELGTALYLDRPLGFAKAPAEPDQTFLASHVLFSRSIAAERLRKLEAHSEVLPDTGALARWQEQLRTLDAGGLPLTDPGALARPGVVSLHDAFRLADDWVILHTTRRSLNDFADQYDLTVLARFGEIVPPRDHWRLLIPAVADGQPIIRVYDRHLGLRMELAADVTRGYRSRGGVEFPAAGLQVLRLWGLGGAGVAEPLELRSEPFHLPPNPERPVLTRTRRRGPPEEGGALTGLLDGQPPQ